MDGMSNGMVYSLVFILDLTQNVAPTDPTHSVLPFKSSGTMDVDIAAPATVIISASVPPAEENAKSQQSDDSQNPQSLPSPPPEVFTARESGERVHGDETVNGQTAGASRPPTSGTSRHQSTASRPDSRQEGHSTAAVPSLNDLRAILAVQPQQNAEAGPSQLVPQAPPHPSKTTKSKERKDTKARLKEKRKLKQRAKAGKLPPQLRTDAPGSDSDDEYWVDGDDIPDHLLIEAVVQGELGKAWSDRGSATPIPDLPQRPPSPAEQFMVPIPPILPSASPPTVRPASPLLTRQRSASPPHSPPRVSNSQDRSSREDRIDPVESLKRGCPASCVHVHSQSPICVSDPNLLGCIYPVNRVPRTRH